MRFRYFFTLTAGRTGSDWLAGFLKENLGIRAIHEPLGIDDFGVRMPDIRLMRMFNDRGNAAPVRAFWRRKLDEIGRQDAYAETNHTLAKCGLIENLAEHGIVGDTAIIVQRRDMARQCASYITRGDFLNITVDWQWYLVPDYRNKIVNPAPFRQFGRIGRALWYCHEMDARQAYYRKLYGGSIGFIETELETLATPGGATAFLEQVGVAGEGAVPILPERRNENVAPRDARVLARIEEILAGLSFDRDGIVERYIAAGKRLDLRAPSQRGETVH